MVLPQQDYTLLNTLEEKFFKGGPVFLPQECRSPLRTGRGLTLAALATNLRAMNESLPMQHLHTLVWAALLAALLAAGAYIHIPLWGVPFSMQPLFAMLAGYLLGPTRGPMAVGLYLLAGLGGLPVFAGGKAGLAVLLGPTGGYLIGFLLGASSTGMAVREETALPSWKTGLAWGVLAQLSIFLPGVVQLKNVLDLTWVKALTIGFVPFILPDILKMLAALAVARYLRKSGLAPK